MPKSDPIREQDQREHLAHVQGLLQAVASAISAIEKNDLRQLEVHLATQETISDRLSDNKWKLSLIAAGEVRPGENPDAQVGQEIRRAYLALAQLNRVYAELVTRARRTVGLIVALYRSHEEGYNHGLSPSPKRHTWSCEV